MINWLHFYPLDNNKVGQKWAIAPLQIDESNCGYYSDRICDMNNHQKEFCVATFGYGKNWAEHNVCDRVTDRYTFHFIFDGKGTFNGQPIAQGDLFVVPPNEKYTIINDAKNPLTLGWIALAGKKLEDQVELFHFFDIPSRTYFLNIEGVRNIFLDTIYGEKSLEKMEHLLFARLFEVLSCCNIPYSPGSYNPKDTMDHYFSQIMSYIAQNFDKDISTDDIAEFIHVSPAYVYRICIQKSGKSPKDIIADHRLKSAKSILANSTIPIGEIAFLVGFSNANSFSRFFTQKCGMSAKEYRMRRTTKS